MNKGTTLEFFGITPSAIPVDVALPLTLKSRKQDLDMLIPPSSIIYRILTRPWVMIADGGCQVVISVSGRAVKTQWIYVWLAIEATVAKCIRAGKGGKSLVPIQR